MPELPEVETVRRTLTELVVGKTLKEIDIFWSKIIKLPDDSHEFKMMLVGQTIQSIDSERQTTAQDYLSEGDAEIGRASCRERV